MFDGKSFFWLCIAKHGKVDGKEPDCFGKDCGDLWVDGGGGQRGRGEPRKKKIGRNVDNGFLSTKSIINFYLQVDEFVLTILATVFLLNTT